MEPHLYADFFYARQRHDRKLWKEDFPGKKFLRFFL